MMTDLDLFWKGWESHGLGHYSRTFNKGYANETVARLHNTDGERPWFTLRTTSGVTLEGPLSEDGVEAVRKVTNSEMGAVLREIQNLIRPLPYATLEEVQAALPGVEVRGAGDKLCVIHSEGRGFYFYYGEDLQTSLQRQLGHFQGTHENYKRQAESCAKSVEALEILLGKIKA